MRMAGSRLRGHDVVSLSQGEPAAETSYRESLAIRQALLPAGDMSVARSQHNLGRWLVRAASGRPMAPRSTMSVIAPSRPRCTA